MLRLSRFSSALFVIGLIASVAAPASYAEVKLPAIFSDHMVLQRDAETPVWGTAAPDEAVTVTMSGYPDGTRHTIVIKAGKDGKWSVNLKPLKAGGPHVLTVKGSNTIEIKDVLVGEVWVGSGQSNMAGGVNGYAKNDQVLAKLAEGTYPQLRLCKGNNGKWQEATPQNIAGFSALLFAFGQRLEYELDVPVGIIVGAVGGTPSGRWLTEEMLKQDAACQEQIKRNATEQPYEKRLADHEKALPRFKELAEKAKADGKPVPREPARPVQAGELTNGKIGDLYAANIQPIVPYAIRGVLWDQGESGTALQGVDQFATMGALIKGWRGAWDQGDFPFLYIQKPSGGGCAWDSGDSVTKNAEAFTALPAGPNKPADGDYSDLHIRIQQHPKTYLVTARDLGSGIHPTNKSGYGQRAARVALGEVYEKKIETSGPLYDSHKIEGNKVRVKFTHIGQGLAWKHGDKLQGFELATEDGSFVWADATIEGDSVIVSSDKVAKPAAVRYAWAQRSPWANLFNKDGLPALTFQTKK
jgi:sialate O-acetylesterase